MLVDAGLLLRENGVLVSRLELKDGKLTLNGQPADGLFAPDGPSAPRSAIWGTAAPRVCRRCAG